MREGWRHHNKALPHSSPPQTPPSPPPPPPTLSLQDKYNAYKGISAGQYPPAAYSLSLALVHLPIALLETAVFSIVLYYLTGLVDEPKRWWYFYGLLCLTNIR